MVVVGLGTFKFFFQFVSTLTEVDYILHMLFHKIILISKNIFRKFSVDNLYERIMIERGEHNVLN